LLIFGRESTAFSLWAIEIAAARENSHLFIRVTQMHATISPTVFLLFALMVGADLSVRESRTRSSPTIQNDDIWSPVKAVNAKLPGINFCAELPLQPHTEPQMALSPESTDPFTRIRLNLDVTLAPWFHIFIQRKVQRFQELILLF
jgi:hypothetical protein